MPDWPAYTTDRRATLMFDTTCTVEDDPAATDREAWDGLL
jgi:carboxylesterase type B